MGRPRSATAHQAHRTIRTALGEAVRQGRIAINHTEIAKAPRLEEEEIEPYTVDEVGRRPMYVFTKPDGELLVPDSDHHHRRGLLSKAGVRDGRLYAARHAAWVCRS